MEGAALPAGGGEGKRAAFGVKDLILTLFPCSDPTTS